MSRLKRRKRKKARIRRQSKKHYKSYLRRIRSSRFQGTIMEKKIIEEPLKTVDFSNVQNNSKMSVLITKIRVFGFRGLENIEIDLEETTVLTGMNNSGKTSVLKALQIAIGNRQFISQDDFNISKNSTSTNLVIDILIMPNTPEGEAISDFSPDWEILFTEDRIMTNSDGISFIPLRTVVSFDQINNNYKSKQYILKQWPEYTDDGTSWYQVDNGKEKNFHFDELPFFYMDAQRDILEDMKIHNSYLGKMISKIEYSDKDVEIIEKQIKDLNEQAVNSSDILSNIRNTLKELDTAMDSSTDGVEITPFTKKLRDLNKGLTIYYTDRKDSFSMEYHGMGTRSWSSLLTLKSFITILNSNSEKEGSPFFPIIAIEEPEAHLHPNAQKKLFSQISSIPGQKIIATHSPYIAATSTLSQIRNIYKGDDTIICGKINTDDFTAEDIRKIARQVINTRGEIFFAKVIVLSEGETEEQALPIFAKHFFNISPIELGIDFIGVGGFGNYLPFLRVAEGLNIPWLLYSDAEEDVKNSVKKQLRDSQSEKSENEVIVFLEDGNKFESQLIKDGYIEEIRNAILKAELQKCVNEQQKEAKTIEIGSYNTERMCQKISGSKATYGPLIAEAIVESTKRLPPSIMDLFTRIRELITVKTTQ